MVSLEAPFAAPAVLGFLSPRGGASEGEFLVKGARCAACLGKIEREVALLPGVKGARLNLTSGRLTVGFDRSDADPFAVVRRLETLGYGCAPYDPTEGRRVADKEGRELAIALAVAGFGAGNVMMFSVPLWAGLFGQELGAGSRETMAWLSALVATPCALFAGRTFFRSAVRALSRGRANMDVPISIGVLLTLGVSFLETAQGRPHAYFDAAVSLVFLLLVGRTLEHRLRVSARSAAKDLLALQAPVARVLGEGGSGDAVPLAQVRVGDRLSVRAGERAPVDGCVVEGGCEADLSLISGETRPEWLGAGAFAPAGALVLGGHLVIRATARAEDSRLADLARLMEIGAQNRSTYVRLADRAAAIYVPVVHTAAAVTFVLAFVLTRSFELSLMRAAAVLIITCPCALGLAVPAVQVAASARLFRRGILVKSGAALERLAEVTRVVFDKTGVLTTATAVRTPRGALLAAASPLARASRHPLSRALAAAGGPGPFAEAVLETPGAGVEGTVGGVRARLGRAGYLAGFASAPPVVGEETELWFARQGEAAQKIEFDETPRPGARAALERLARQGVAAEMLSGDRPRAVARAAEILGLSCAVGAVGPEAKLARIKSLQEGGARVLMVGDGLNDAAALSCAHASMAPGEACAVSQTAADLVFTGEDLDAVPEAIAVARAARALALENFGFAALYNLIAMPAAMAGLVTPLWAALAMSSTSLIVTLNAARMTFLGRRPTR